MSATLPVADDEPTGSSMTLTYYSDEVGGSCVAEAGSEPKDLPDSQCKSTTPEPTMPIPPLERAYCTHKCLLGLKNEHEVDHDCPNATYHGDSHIPFSRFIYEMKELLRRVTENRISDEVTGCKRLPLSGSRGSLFRICLVEYGGYTLVGKGFETADFSWQEAERKAYEKLESLQGHFIPVFCCALDLKRPWLHSISANKHILLLSYAGVSLDNLDKSLFTKTILDGHFKALEAIHGAKMVHGSVQPRNMVYDEAHDLAMFIDLERTVSMPAENHKKQSAKEWYKLMDLMDLMDS